MDKVTNKEILERTGLPSMEDLLIRKRGRPRLRFKDTIKRNLKLRDIKTDSWTSLSQQRDKWRALVKWWKQFLSHGDRQHDDDEEDIFKGVMATSKPSSDR